MKDKDQLMLCSAEDLADTIIEYRKIVASLKSQLKHARNEADSLWHYKQSTPPHCYHQMGQ